MSITQKALQFALEAQHEHQEDLAEAILGEVDIGSLGIKDADEESIIQLISAFVEVDLLPAAVKALSHAAKHKYRFGEKVYSPLLTALARKGAWRHYNSLLCLMTEFADEKTLKQISHHLLNQLEIEKASKALEILEQRSKSEDLAETVALLIAKREYGEVAKQLSENKALIRTLLDDSSLRHWLHVFLYYAEEIWTIRALDNLASEESPSYSLLDNYAHLLKLCLSRNWGHLSKKIIQSIDSEISSELLNKHLVFCRVYVFTCQRLSIATPMLDRLKNPDTGVFSHEEIWSINFKSQLASEGLENGLVAQFGQIDRTPSKKKIVVLPLVIYGEEYIQACRDFFVRSALAAEDFLELANRFHVIIRICTNPESQPRLEQILRPLEERGFVIDLTRGVFSSSELPHKRMWPYLDALYMAEQHGGIFLSLCPDAIFGNGMGKLVDMCPEGGGAGGGLFRASWSGAVKSLRSGELDTVLHSESKNRELASLGISKWAHYSQRLFFENLSPNYFNRVHNGSRFNSWLGTPQVIRPSKGLTEQVLARSIYRYSNTFADHICQDLDHEFIGILNNEGLLRMVDSYEDFVFVELAKDAGYSQLWKFQLPMGYELPTPVGEVFPYI